METDAKTHLDGHGCILLHELGKVVEARRDGEGHEADLHHGRHPAQQVEEPHFVNL